MSMYPDLPYSSCMESSQRSLSPVAETDRTLRTKCSSVNVTSTPVRAVWPIYSKKPSSVLDEQNKPHCKTLLFDVPGKVGRVRSGELSRVM